MFLVAGFYCIENKLNKLHFIRITGRFLWGIVGQIIPHYCKQLGKSVADGTNALLLVREPKNIFCHELFNIIYTSQNILNLWAVAKQSPVLEN